MNESFEDGQGVEFEASQVLDGPVCACAHTCVCVCACAACERVWGGRACACACVWCVDSNGCGESFGFAAPRCVAASGCRVIGTPPAPHPPLGTLPALGDRPQGGHGVECKAKRVLVN